MKFAFILNPVAGGFAARRSRSRLLQALRSSGIDYEVEFTEGRGHAMHLARSAAERGFAVVAAGGDGTAHEVASGIIQSGSDVPMAVIPMGTGNDFAKMFELPGSEAEFLQRLADGHSQAIDYGQITWQGPCGAGVDYFINIGGTGFDARVAMAASRFKWLTGTPRYVASVLRTLNGWRAPDVELHLSRGGVTVHAYTGRLFLAMAGNGACSGGGFYLTPHASICDGMLDACIISDVSTARVLWLLPKALNGRHLAASQVHVEKTERMIIKSETPLPVQGDGELLSEGATEIVMEIVPNGLRTLLPVKM